MKHLIPTLVVALVSCSASAEDLTQCLQGWQLTQAARYADAIRSYQACIDTGDLSTQALARTYRNIGITYRRDKQPLKAVAAYDKAIALHPEDVVDDYINRGNAHDEANDFDAALADYATALKLQPEDGEIYYNRGIAYEHVRQFARAQADFVAAYNHGLRTQLLHERFVVYGIAILWKP